MTEFLNADAFLNHLLSCFFNDMTVTQADNYDAARFSADGIDRSDIPYTHLHKETLLAVTRQTEEFFKAYNLLADKTSKGLYLDLLRYRLAGHKHVRLPTNNAAYHARYNAAMAFPVREVKTLEIGKQKLTLNSYDYTFEGQKLDMDILTLAWPFMLGQYYFERDGVTIKPQRGDYVIDGGACLGDTALAFGASAGPQGRVYAFEILEPHLRILRDNIARNACVCAFEIMEYGLSDTSRPASSNETQEVPCDFGFELDEADERFALTRLDDLVASGAIPRVDFIKLDIEGSELKALQGAKETLRRFAPRLAISLYHHTRDFYELPLFLNSLGVGYCFYLDHYTIHAGETVLYAVKK